MPKLWNAVDILYLTVCATVGLVCLYLALFKAFRIKNRDESRFFLLNALAWLANLAYLASLHFFDAATLVDGPDRRLTIFSLNVGAGLFYFLGATYRESTRVQMRVLRVSAYAFAATLVALAFVEYTLTTSLRLTAPLGVLFGAIGMAACARGWQVLLRDSRAPRRHQISLHFSMYAYAALQFAALAPSLHDSSPTSGDGAWWVFLFGLSTRLTHLYGLQGFSEGLFADYRRLALAEDQSAATIKRANLTVKMLSQLAHEVNTPAAELRLRVTELSARHHSREVQVEEWGHLASLVEQITGPIDAFDKWVTADSSSGPIARGVYNLNAICEDTIMQLKSVMRPSLLIQRHYVSRPTIHGNYGHLLQITRNLLKNAIESVLLARDREGRISVATSFEDTAAGRLVVLTITDNGIGIPPKDLDAVFLDGFTTKKGTGRGHGLHIVSSLVIEHNGAIELANATVGPGAVAVLRLPFSASEK